ncbi:MAG TPA: response regulator [Anaerolineae bacterium]|nr:response regulator [Anaerolineae bacterium]
MPETAATPSIKLSDPVPKCILVVDDEPAFCAVVCEILRLYGFTAHAAKDAMQALEMLDEIHPDIILADVMMPEIDGLSLLRKLRSQKAWKSIPTIVISAKCEPDDFSAAFSAGANACLSKPFSASELRETVERLVYAT